jgi:hypothetical protein
MMTWMPQFPTERGNDDLSARHLRHYRRPHAHYRLLRDERAVVPYPGFSQTVGFAASVTAIVLTGLILYLVFKRNDWL